MKIDDIGWLILGELQRDARISFRELAARVGLTAPAVAERVRRMERDGVIQGYAVRLSADRLGLPITAVIRMNASPGKGLQIDDVVQDIPEVLECHRVTGSESHVIRAAVASTAHLETLLHKLWDYGDTVTNIVTSSPVPRRGVALPPPIPNQ